jgi:Cu/Ag efflux protein CusF
MRRLSIHALAAFVVILGAGRLPADEIRGKVKSVDPDKATVTLSAGDVDKTLNVATGAKVTGLFGKKLKKAVTQDVPGGLRGVPQGAEVSLTTEAKDGKAVVTQVKVEDLQPKVKGKAKKKKAKAE